LRPGHIPIDLAWAEFRGALAGPESYLRARRILREQMADMRRRGSLEPEAATEQTVMSAFDHSHPLIDPAPIAVVRRS